MKIKLNFNLKIFTLIFILIIPFLCPNYITNRVAIIGKFINLSKYFELLILLVIGLVYIGKKNKIFIFILLYYITMFISCLLNNIPLTNFLNKVVYVIGPLLIIIIFGKKYTYEMILAFLCFYEICIYINMISILKYPQHGLYTIKSYFTPFLIEKYDYWFIGIDNSHIMYFIPGLLFSCIYSFYKGDKLSLRTILLLIAIIISAVIRWSATTIVFTFLIILFLIFRRWIQNINILNMKNYIIASLTMNFLIVICRIQNIFKYIIVDILKKDLTFTNRTYIWDDTIKLISKKPILGYGYESEAQRYIKGISFHAFHSHNAILDILYFGGIIALLIYLIILFMAAKKLKNSKEKNLSSILAFFTLLVFIISLTETYSMFMIFSIISLISIYDIIIKDIKFRKERRLNYA